MTSWRLQWLCVYTHTVYTHPHICMCVYSYTHSLLVISFGFFFHFLIVMLWVTVFCFVSSTYRTIWLSPSVTPPVKDPVKHVRGMFSRVQGQTEPNSEPTELTWKWSTLLACSCVRCTEDRGHDGLFESCSRNRVFFNPSKGEKDIPISRLIYTSFPIYFFPSLYFMWKHFRTCSSHTRMLPQPVIPAFPHKRLYLIIGCSGKQG